MNVLVLKSSILADNSQSNKLADYTIEKLKGHNIVVRDLAAQQLPHLSDELVAELKAADIIVIGAPMYNLGIPTQLKSYFDFIARPRVTFQYTANGPEGLLQGKKAIVLASFGGMYDENNNVTNYLKAILGFVGITDVQFAYAKGIGLGAEAIEKAQRSARNKIDEIVASL